MTVVLLALVRLDTGHIDAEGVACPFRLVDRPDVVADRRAVPHLRPKPTKALIAGLRGVIDNGPGRHAQCHGQARALTNGQG
jgi:hypothetical protein